MWVVTNYCICSAIHGIMRLGSVFRQRLTLIRDAPVERDDNPIHLLSEMTDVGFESIREIHRAARKIRARGAAAIPIVAKETDPQSPCLSDHWRMSCPLVDCRSKGSHTCECERIKRLQYPSAPTIEQVIVGQRHHVYPCPCQGSGKFRVHSVRIVAVLSPCLPRERAFQVTQHDICSPQERQDSLKRVICPVLGDHCLGTSTKHNVTGGNEREGRFLEGVEMPLQLFSRK